MARIEEALGVIGGAECAFFGPAGNILGILANPLFHAGPLNELHAVRLLNLVVSAIPILYIVRRCRTGWLFVVFPPLFSYAWLAKTTAS